MFCKNNRIQLLNVGDFTLLLNCVGISCYHNVCPMLWHFFQDRKPGKRGDYTAGSRGGRLLPADGITGGYGSYQCGCYSASKRASCPNPAGWLDCTKIQLLCYLFYCICTTKPAFIYFGCIGLNLCVGCRC